MSQNTPPTVQRTVVLGSTSRYRRELLSRLNLNFEVAAPDVDETPHTGEYRCSLVAQLSICIITFFSVASCHNNLWFFHITSNS